MMYSLLLRSRKYRIIFLVLFAFGCSADSAGVRPPEALQRSALRAPRPELHPERRGYKPRLILRDDVEVRKSLQHYLGRGRPFIDDALKRWELYRRTFHDVFTQYGVPVEMGNLAIIESRLLKDARSHRGAVGLWQFMPRTARRFGLRVSVFADERKDPRKSTEAAARYLKKLHNRFDDWFLAVAAYNCGPSRLASIIKREGTDDFFELARRRALSRETRRSVYRFIAVTMILRNRSVYGF